MWLMLLIGLQVTDRYQLQELTEHWEHKSNHIKQEEIYKDIEELEDVLLFLGEDFDIHYTHRLQKSYLRYMKEMKRNRVKVLRTEQI